MKEGIHPKEYRTVVFKDISCDESFLTKFTGKMKFVDTAGRIDKFNTRFAKYAKKMEKPGQEEES